MDYEYEDEDIIENAYFDSSIDDAVFTAAESVSGKTFKNEKIKLERQYNRLAEMYYEAFSPFAFKMGIIVFLALIVLAGISLGIAIYYGSILWVRITALFTGASCGGLLMFIAATGLRFLLFYINYRRTRKLYETVKALAEKSMSISINLIDTRFDVNGYTLMFVEDDESIKKFIE